MTLVERAESVRRFAMLSIAAQLCLTAAAWLLPLFSEFHFTDDTISELALGRFGYLQTAAFVIAGGGTLVLARAIERMTIPSRASVSGVRLIYFYGVAIVLLGVFPTEEIDAPMEIWSQGTVGLLHAWISTLAFPAAVIGMVLLTLAFRNQARWRPISNGSGACAALALALLFVQSEGPLIGLMRRLLVGVISAWLILVALRIRTTIAPRRAG